MAEHMPTTQKAEAEGLNVALTMDNYPQCLRGDTASDMADGCASIACFLREAVPATMKAFRDTGYPAGNRYERTIEGLALVCDLLVDRLEIAAGEGFSPMPLIRDLEGRHG